MSDTHRGHEPQDFRAWAIALLLAACLFAIFVALGVVRGMFWVAGAPFAERPAIEGQAFPPPRLQTSPQSDLAKAESQWRARLQGYGWVDRTHGLIHIPIDEAMRVVADRGRKAYAPIPGKAADGVPNADPKEGGR